MKEPFQLRLLRLQADLRARLRDVHDARKAVVYGLRKTREVFAAPEATVAILKPGHARADLIITIPRDGAWDADLLTGYIEGTRPRIPRHTLLAPVKRRRRHWAVFALRNREQPFTAAHRQALFQVTQILTEIVQAVDEKRRRKVRWRIEHKLADRQEPRDLIYDILHGLRSLIRYDHSASLFLARDGSGALELVAEQIAWAKAKSRRIGLRLALDAALRDRLDGGGVQLFERRGGRWQGPQGDTAPALPELLDDSSRDTPPQVAMLCAPIATPGGAFGVLKISARRRDVLGEHEAYLVEEFLPLTSLAVQFFVRTESLQAQILKSERKHALANLTRGITHDLNNALGAMLPLVQQMRDDVAGGRLEAETLAEDLESIERSLQTCRRIFRGMLAIARGSAQGPGHGNLRRAVDGALSVLEDSLKRRSIDVALDLPKEIPTIHGSQGDLTQVFLNVFTNARDAMPDGGHLRITASNRPQTVEVEVTDNGDGISKATLERVSEPFFTTKQRGNGLGLSICRSILWDIDADMRIDSVEGEGTTVRISLPVFDKDHDDGQERPEKTEKVLEEAR